MLSTTILPTLFLFPSTSRKAPYLRYYSLSIVKFIEFVKMKSICIDVKLKSIGAHAESLTFSLKLEERFHVLNLLMDVLKFELLSPNSSWKSRIRSQPYFRRAWAWKNYIFDRARVNVGLRLQFFNQYLWLPSIISSNNNRSQSGKHILVEPKLDINYLPKTRVRKKLLPGAEANFNKNGLDEIDF